MGKLKKETATCRKCKNVLHFAQFQGMRIIEDGLLAARCIICGAHYTMPPAPPNEKEEGIKSKSWAQGDKRVNAYMPPITRALNAAGLTEFDARRKGVYNACYQAVFKAIRDYTGDIG